MPSIKLNFSDTIAFTLQQEAEMAGCDVAEVLRRGTASYIIAMTAQRDIAAHFPEGEVLSFSFIIEAESTDGTFKQFELHPDLSDPAHTQIKLVEDL